jgi:hypothetical protein
MGAALPRNRTAAPQVAQPDIPIASPPVTHQLVRFPDSNLMSIVESCKRTVSVATSDINDAMVNFA